MELGGSHAPWCTTASISASISHPGRVIVPRDRHRILVVEGNLGGGYDMGLENAVDLAGTLQTQHGMQMEISIVGKADESQRRADPGSCTRSDSLGGSG